MASHFKGKAPIFDTPDVMVSSVNEPNVTSEEIVAIDPIHCNSKDPVGVTHLSLELKSRIRGHLQEICNNTDFVTKYDMSTTKSGKPAVYAFTIFSTPYKYFLEVFPRINRPCQEDMNKGPEAFTFHEHIEDAIDRYTGSNKKPNQCLRETRSTDFCYPLAVHVEAVPLDKAKKPQQLLLLREFQVLIAIWEQYRNELNQKKCNQDQLVGIPMPFEFCCVPNTEYEIPIKSFETYTYFNINGNAMDFKTPFKLPLTNATSLSSTMSYMTAEKLGPSVSYLIDLLRSQSRGFSMATALMIYDQLLSRLIVLHRYGVVHGDLNTECLKFGSGNACNVLYISDFSTSVVTPSKFAPMFLYHDRFVSSLRIKDKIFHFLHDLESAYYIFLLLALGHLPWDNRLKPYPNHTPQEGKGRETNPMAEMSNTQKEKDIFWETPNLINRLVSSKEFDAEGALYQNFIEDLMVSMYNKMKDVMNSCARLSQEAFVRDTSIYGTAANNAYLGLRKIIASYFRFEMLNPFLKDPAVDIKISMLRAHDPEDRRAAWDLSSWCWNNIFVDTKQVSPLAVQNAQKIIHNAE